MKLNLTVSCDVVDRNFEGRDFTREEVALLVEMIESKLALNNRIDMRVEVQPKDWETESFYLTNVEVKEST